MWANTLLLALREIRRNLLRSFLTILGIVIGVAAVITMVTVGNGATQAVQDQITSLGTNLLQIRPGQRLGPGRDAAGSPPFRIADAEAIANMKSVSEDVLRAVAQRREWMKKYALMSAIVRNPRSPIDVTLPLILRLSQRDQTALSTDRNVPEAVRVTARRIVQRRQL